MFKEMHITAPLMVFLLQEKWIGIGMERSVSGNFFLLSSIGLESTQMKKCFSRKFPRVIDRIDETKSS